MKSKNPIVNRICDQLEKLDLISNSELSFFVFNGTGCQP